MPEYRFAHFLAESFRALRDEIPHAYLRFCRQLFPRAVELVVDGETVWLHFERDDVRLVGNAVAPAITIETSRAAILEVIDAASTLLDAALNDGMVVRARPDDVLAFYDALTIYVHGAVRAPSIPGLLQAYRHSRPAAPAVRSDAMQVTITSGYGRV